MYGVGCFWNNNIAHVLLIACGVRIGEMSNHEQRSVEISMNLQPPNPFCYKKTEQWPKWRCHFNQYCVVSGLVGREEEQQVSTLLYCLGEDAEDILGTTRIAVDNKKKYDKVAEAFDNYFKVCKNIIFERARFNKRNQLPNESAEQFITVMHRMAENCEFGNIKDELIHDRFVVGICDESLSKRLQMKAELTLDKAK